MYNKKKTQHVQGSIPLWFQASSGGHGTYRPWIRGTTVVHSVEQQAFRKQIEMCVLIPWHMIRCDHSDTLSVIQWGEIQRKKLQIIFFLSTDEKSVVNLWKLLCKLSVKFQRKGDVCSYMPLFISKPILTQIMFRKHPAVLSNIAPIVKFTAKRGSAMKSKSETLGKRGVLSSGL